jgi:hypothetical protein
MFNRGNYWQKALDGQLGMKVTRESHPSPPLANEPYCTRSQQVSLYDNDTDDEIARLHLYRRPDGNIGLSGKPDPKRLVIGGTMYRLLKG